MQLRFFLNQTVNGSIHSGVFLLKILDVSFLTFQDILQIQVLVEQPAKHNDDLFKDRLYLLAVGFRRLQRSGSRQHCVHIIGILPGKVLNILQYGGKLVHPSSCFFCLCNGCAGLVLCSILSFVQEVDLVQNLNLPTLQCYEALLFLLNLELCHSQMFLGAAVFTALNVGVPGFDHVPVEIVL